MKYLLTLIILFLLNPGEFGRQRITDDSIIVDSSISLEEALKGNNVPLWIKQNLSIVDVYYYSFDGRLHKGQIVIHQKLENDIKEIFEIIKEKKFPVEKVKPVSFYNWNDDLSMKDNNTSAFNYRKVKGTKVISAHATGRAIDINPLLNPQIKKGKVYPDNAEYNPSKEGTITKESFLVKEFTKRGWQWGGRWRSSKDYQHFEKKL